MAENILGLPPKEMKAVKARYAALVNEIGREKAEELIELRKKLDFHNGQMAFMERFKLAERARIEAQRREKSGRKTKKRP